MLSRSGALSEDLPIGFDEGFVDDVVVDELFFLPIDDDERRLDEKKY